MEGADLHAEVAREDHSLEANQQSAGKETDISIGELIEF